MYYSGITFFKEMQDITNISSCFVLNFFFKRRKVFSAIKHFSFNEIRLSI